MLYSEAQVKTSVRMLGETEHFLFVCELSSGLILAYKMVFFLNLSMS